MYREIPQRLNLLLSTGFIFLHLYIFYLFPLSGIENSWLIWLIPLTALATPQMWALIHDSGHLVLFKNRGLNNLFGRFMSILFGSNFKLLQFGHNVHHGFNRTEVDRTDIFNEATAPLAASAFYYAKIFFGLYLGEVLMPLLFLLPKRTIAFLAGRLFLGKSDLHAKVYQQFQTALLTEKNLRIIRFDTLLLMLHFWAVFSLYGSEWYLLALFFGIRAFMVSFLDNVYHYATPKDTDHSYNLFLPALFSRLLLNFNYHQVHHTYPNIPWINLPLRFQEDRLEFDKAYPQALVAQLKGPIRA